MYLIAGIKLVRLFLLKNTIETDTCFFQRRIQYIKNYLKYVTEFYGVMYFVLCTMLGIMFTPTVYHEIGLSAVILVCSVLFVFILAFFIGK